MLCREELDEFSGAILSVAGCVDALGAAAFSAESGFSFGLAAPARIVSSACLICSADGADPPLVTQAHRHASQVIVCGGRRPPTGRTDRPSLLRVRAKRSPPTSISRVRLRVNSCMVDTPQILAIGGRPSAG